MNLLYIYIGSIGLAIGFLLSLLLGIYSKSTASAATFKYFGVSISDVITNATLFFLGFVVAILSVTSVLVRDLKYPIESPIKFTIETFLMGTLCASVIFAMTYLRGYSVNHETLYEFILLFVKFALIHILFQFSGVYSQFFSYKKQ